MKLYEKNLADDSFREGKEEDIDDIEGIEARQPSLNLDAKQLAALEKKLKEYLSVEDYEMASQIRDKINKIKNPS